MNNAGEITTRQRRRVRTKSIILQAAQELLTENGLENLTLTEIAHRAAYSKPAIYEYFEGIENILYELSNQGFIQLGERLKSISRELLPDERLIATGYTTIRFAEENRELYKLMFTRVVPDPRDFGMRSETQTPFQFLAETIQEGIKQGMFKTRPDFDWKTMAYISWTMVHGMASLKKTLLDELEFDIEKNRADALNFLVQSLKGKVTE
jgi:AcrR family transcriptional regulator